MNVQPAIWLVCDEPNQQSKWQGLCQATGYAPRVCASLSELMESLRLSTDDAPVLLVSAEPGKALLLQRMLHASNLARTVLHLFYAPNTRCQVTVMREGDSTGHDPGEAGTAVLHRLGQLTQSGSNGHVQAMSRPEVTDLARRMERLTHREMQVMRRVVQGMMNKQIAADLDLSPKTIEVHRAHVMEKMKAESLADLVRMAVKLEDAQELEVVAA